jgi:hypothetical protein
MSWYLCQNSAVANTGISRILVPAQSLLRVAGRALRSSVLSAQKQALVQYRQRQDYTPRTPRSPPALVRRCDRRTPTRPSRPVKVQCLDDDGVNLHLWHRIQACGLLPQDEHGCLNYGLGLSPEVPGQDRRGEMVGDNVKGGDYQMVGKMALSARKRKQIM